MVVLIVKGVDIAFDEFKDHLEPIDALRTEALAAGGGKLSMRDGRRRPVRMQMPVANRARQIGMAMAA